MLKVDRSFVADVVVESRAIDLLEGLTRFARALAMQVVAEGVEHARQLEVLRQLDCDGAQGFHLARPQAAARFEALLAGRPIW
jgi:EAL domain-containing protein (putative c-di-GMP-specific phosphodiesterase class I)